MKKYRERKLSSFLCTSFDRVIQGICLKYCKGFIDLNFQFDRILEKTKKIPIFKLLFVLNLYKILVYPCCQKLKKFPKFFSLMQQKFIIHVEILLIWKFLSFFFFVAVKSVWIIHESMPLFLWLFLFRSSCWPFNMMKTI